MLLFLLLLLLSSAAASSLVEMRSMYSGHPACVVVSPSNSSSSSIAYQSLPFLWNTIVNVSSISLSLNPCGELPGAPHISVAVTGVDYGHLSSLLVAPIMEWDGVIMHLRSADGMRSSALRLGCDILGSLAGGFRVLNASLVNSSHVEVSIVSKAACPNLHCMEIRGECLRYSSVLLTPRRECAIGVPRILAPDQYWRPECDYSFLYGFNLFMAVLYAVTALFNAVLLVCLLWLRVGTGFHKAISIFGLTSALSFFLFYLSNYIEPHPTTIAFARFELMPMYVGYGAGLSQIVVLPVMWLSIKLDAKKSMPENQKRFWTVFVYTLAFLEVVPFLVTSFIVEADLGFSIITCLAVGMVCPLVCNIIGYIFLRMVYKVRKKRLDLKVQKMSGEEDELWIVMRRFLVFFSVADLLVPVVIVPLLLVTLDYIQAGVQLDTAARDGLWAASVLAFFFYQPMVVWYSSAVAKVIYARRKPSSSLESTEETGAESLDAYLSSIE